MNDRNVGLKLLLGAVALIAVGAAAWWLVKALIGLAFYLIVGVVVVAGGIYLYGRARAAVKGAPRRRRLGR